MRLTKMQGLGNDYLYVFGELKEPEKWAIRLSDRHFGIGSDGLILMNHSTTADFCMHIFNADGSEAKMCGNGIRCVGKYLYDKGYTTKTSLDIETLSGLRHLELHIKEEKVDSVTVDMGQIQLEPVVSLPFNIQGIPLSVGNPHVVIFVEDMEKVPLTEWGPVIEKHSHFPDGVNVEFVQLLDSKTLRMRVWERGSGVTMACGTGACASAAAAVSAGYCNYKEDICVKLDGGDLLIRLNEDNSAQMTGPAVTICECEVK